MYAQCPNNPFKAHLQNLHSKIILLCTFFYVCWGKKKKKKKVLTMWILLEEEYDNTLSLGYMFICVLMKF